MKTFENGILKADSLEEVNGNEIFRSNTAIIGGKVIKDRFNRLQGDNQNAE